MSTRIRMMKCCAVAATLLLATGCVPFPHKQVTMPNIDGRVHHGDTPLAGARIYQAEWDDELKADRCPAGSAALAVSDASGNFHIPFREEWSYFMVMDPFSSLKLCLTEGDQVHDALQLYLMGGMYAKLILDCDLDAKPPAPVDLMNPPRKSGLCRVLQPDAIDPQPVFAPGKEVLPDLFSGMTWEYDESLAKNKLPGSTLYTTDYDEGRMTASIYSGIALPDFGPAQVEFIHETKSKRITVFHIAADEPRLEQCAMEKTTHPGDCRNRYGPHLAKLRDRIYAHIKPLYGPGKESTECDWNYEATPSTRVCEKSYSWQPDPATEMTLSITKGEDGWWEVGLSLFRRTAPAPSQLH